MKQFSSLTNCKKILIIMIDKLHKSTYCENLHFHLHNTEKGQEEYYMLITSKRAEEHAVLSVAQAMAAAARTAPKTRGIDRISTVVLTGDDLTALADKLEAMADEPTGRSSFVRDAENLRNSQAVVLIGTQEAKTGLNDACRLCHFNDCADCSAHNGVCVFNPMDLGIAVGSAVSVAADNRIDNRVMFSVGMAAKAMHILGDDVTMIIGIPLSASGKSIYFDR